MREAIIKEIIGEVREVVGMGYEVTGGKVTKNNSVEIYGISIVAKGQSIAPTIYIDGFVAEIEGGRMTSKEAAEKVVRVYEANKHLPEGMNVKNFGDKEFILSHVNYQVVNREKNTELLREVPHKDFLDLSAIYRVVISRDELGIRSFVLKREVMMAAGITEQELDRSAETNTTQQGFQILSMAEIIRAMGAPEEAVEMSKCGPRVFVLTNGTKVHGASVLLNKAALNRLSEQIGGDFYILPSSIHEVIAVPMEDIEQAEYLKEMVGEVNTNEVDDEEILSYQIYKYRYEDNELSIAN